MLLYDCDRDDGSAFGFGWADCVCRDVVGKQILFMDC